MRIRKGRLLPPLLLLLALFAQAQRPVRNGVDVLADHHFAELRSLAHGRPTRIAVVTNDAARTLGGERAIDLLAHAEGLTLVRIFAPEHGSAARLDTEKIGDARDAATGLPIVSVYGATDAARRPKLEQLRDLDAVVFDLQDAGVRWFTYETTLGYFLEGCAAAKIPLVVLDRPNPLGGVRGGVVSTRERKSFTNYFPLPEAHGMTIGELARLFNAHAAADGQPIGARLLVVPMQGWRRSMRFVDTGQQWRPPTPNLRSLAAVDLYPVLSLVEGANVSVGRGSDEPFQLLGAPWLDGDKLLAALRAMNLPGLAFTRAEFTPRESKFKGELCHGVRLRVIDVKKYDAANAGLALLAALVRVGGERFESAKLSTLVANDAFLARLIEQVKSGGAWAPYVMPVGQRRVFGEEFREAQLYED